MLRHAQKDQASVETDDKPRVPWRNRIMRDGLSGMLLIGTLLLVALAFESFHQDVPNPTKPPTHVPSKPPVETAYDTARGRMQYWPEKAKTKMLVPPRPISPDTKRSGSEICSEVDLFTAARCEKGGGGRRRRRGVT